MLISIHVPLYTIYVQMSRGLMTSECNAGGRMLSLSYHLTTGAVWHSLVSDYFVNYIYDKRWNLLEHYFIIHFIIIIKKNNR